MVLNRIYWVGVLTLCCWIVVQGLESRFVSTEARQALICLIFLSHGVVGGPRDICSWCLV